MIVHLTENQQSADWLRTHREQKQLNKSRDFSAFVRTVVPVATVKKGVLKSGRLRAYGGIQILEKSEGENPRLIIAGYASPQVVDREKHVITKEALARDLPRFMAEPDYRNANLLHSNVQVGKVIPYHVTEDGKRYDTKVDDIGLFVVVEVRTDAARPKICDKVAEDIRSGKLQAFSISADAPYESRRYECAGGTCFWVIDAIELYEITICETPVNQDAKFTLLTKSVNPLAEFAPYMHCKDGSCPLPFNEAVVVLKSQGITDFSTKREAGTMQEGPSGGVGSRRGRGGAAARGEQIGDDPQAPLDLGHDFEDVFDPDNPLNSPRRDVLAKQLSFGQLFDLAMSDSSGDLLREVVRMAQEEYPPKPPLPHLDGDLHNADWTKRTDDTQTGRVRRSPKSKLDRAKKYIHNPSEAPAGVQVHHGKKGGIYYETSAVTGHTVDDPNESLASEDEQDGSTPHDPYIRRPEDLYEADGVLALHSGGIDYESSGIATQQKHKIQQIIGKRLSDYLEGEDWEQETLLYNAGELFGMKMNNIREDYNCDNWHETFAAAATHAWAQSSSDTNMASVCLQQIVAVEFNLPTLEESGLTIAPRIKKEMDRISDTKPEAWEAMRAYVKAVYAQTQEELKAAGLETVPLVRGMAWAPDAAPEWIKNLIEPVTEESDIAPKPGRPMAYPDAEDGKAMVTFVGTPDLETVLGSSVGKNFRIMVNNDVGMLRVHQTPMRFNAHGSRVKITLQDENDPLSDRIVSIDDRAPLKMTVKDVKSFMDEEGAEEVQLPRIRFDIYDGKGQWIGGKFHSDLEIMHKSGGISFREQVIIGYKEHGTGARRFLSLTPQQAMAYQGKKAVERGEYVGSIDATLNPISSFSTDYTTARGYGMDTRGYQAIVFGHVPRERIFSKWGSGPGCLDEHELVVLGGSITTGIYANKIADDTPYDDQLPASFEDVWGRWQDQSVKKAVSIGSLDMLRKTGNLPNTDDDEEQYLNEQTSYVQLPGEHGPDVTVKPGDNDPQHGGDTKVKLAFGTKRSGPIGQGPIVNLNGTPEHFHLSLKHDLGQTSPDEESRLAQLDKDNEASGFPPDSGYGTVITGEDKPEEPEHQARLKQPKLQPPISGTPSIMRSADEALSRVATRLDLSARTAEAVHAVRLRIAKGESPFDWRFGAWQVPGTDLSAQFLTSRLLRRADVDTRAWLSTLQRQLAETPPITPTRGALIAKQLVPHLRRLGITGTALQKAMPPVEAGPDPKRDLLAIMRTTAAIVHQPTLRERVAPRVLHALDQIYEEAKRAVDGLDLGLSLGLSGDGQLPPDDPKVEYRPAELASERCGVCRHFRDNGTCALVLGAIKPEMVCNLFSSGDPEHEIIQNAGAQQTVRDVMQTDRLLGAVTKAQMPQQKTQDEAEAADSRPEMATGHDGAMIAWYPSTGLSRQFAHEGGEPADELHVTVIYLGKIAKLGPKHQRAILDIVARHVQASPPIEGEITRIEHFEPSEHSEGKVPIVALIDAPDLHSFRDGLLRDIQQAGIEVPNDFPDFKPHMTLKYDLPGMDDMQERGIPEVESTPIEVDRLFVVFGDQKHEFSFDAGGLTQIHGKDPAAYRAKTLKAGDEDALAFGALYGRLWKRGFGDRRYRLALVKDDGSILSLDD